MSVLLAICTVSCVSWIITREALFADLRTWAGTKGKWAQPLTCAYCLCPWIAALVCLTHGLPLVYFFPIVWAAYVNLSLYARVRG